MIDLITKRDIPSTQAISVDWVKAIDEAGAAVQFSLDLNSKCHSKCKKNGGQIDVKTDNVNTYKNALDMSIAVYKIQEDIRRMYRGDAVDEYFKMLDNPYIRFLLKEKKNTVIDETGRVVVTHGQ